MFGRSDISEKAQEGYLAQRDSAGSLSREDTILLSGTQTNDHGYAELYWGDFTVDQ